MKKYLVWFAEIIIVITVFLVIDNYLERRDVVIKADGKGYYDYLPAAFIYHDLNFLYTDTLVTEYYDHQSYGSGYLKTVNGHQVNKYFPGASILWAPFFWGGHLYALNSVYPADGYSLPYQMSIYAAALFYLWLGLLFTRLILSEKKINPWAIFIIQSVLALATPIINYVHFDASFVHVYCFALITGFYYLFSRFITFNQSRYLIYSGFILGLIFLVRPVNVMAVILLFLMFEDYESLKGWLNNHFKNQWKKLVVPFGVFISVISLLPILWKFQTGQFFIWGYQGESFNFLSPTVFNFMFSSRKGLFVHTPVLGLVMIAAIVIWISTKRYYSLFVNLLVGYIIVYVLSSWWSWYYGTSFGSRPSIDFYIIFALMAASVFQLAQKKVLKIVFGLSLISMIPINIIQAFQYQHYIMDWDQMTFEKFNTIRLHTEDKYRGVFFQPKVEYQKNEVGFEDSLIFEQPIQIRDGRELIYDVDSNVLKANYSHVHLEMECYLQEGNSDVILTGENALQEIVFEKRLNTFKALKRDHRRGEANFYFKLKDMDQISRIKLEIQSWNDEVSIYSLKVKMLQKE